MGEGHLFYVIGVGPGDPSYLTKIGAEIISSSEVLVGARRHLDSFAANGQQTVEIGASNIKDIIDYISENKDQKKISVLVSGDPGFYSFGKLIIENFKSDDFEFAPGISSVQLAFSRLKKPWDDAAFVSLHGRQLSSELTNEATKKIEMFQYCCFLGDKDIDPLELMERLLNRDEYNAFLLCDLSLPTERIVNMNNKDKLELDGFGNWILVLERK